MTGIYNNKTRAWAVKSVCLVTGCMQDTFDRATQLAGRPSAAHDNRSYCIRSDMLLLFAKLPNDLPEGHFGNSIVSRKTYKGGDNLLARIMGILKPRGGGGGGGGPRPKYMIFDMFCRLLLNDVLAKQWHSHPQIHINI